MVFLDGERIDKGFEDIREKLPREINTLGDKRPEPRLPMGSKR